MKTILTGARPTGQLHIGNYLGAIKPIIELSENYSDVRLFTATLHSFTDQCPRDTVGLIQGLVKDYIAAGVNPAKIMIFDQMSIAREIALATLYFSKLVTVNKLMRIPTLKDKLRNENDELGSANALLLQYPLMMAADILLQGTSLVPVGVDQRSHIEFSRDLAERFHSEYAAINVLTTPESLIQEELNVISLHGEGKMSKTKPAGAIFLGDTSANIIKKIRGAKTGQAGESTDASRSLLLIGEQLATTVQKNELKSIYAEHLDGRPVMGSFKDLLATIIVSFVSDFKGRRESVLDKQVADILQEGGEKARASANETLKAMEVAMTGKVFSFYG